MRLTAILFACGLLIPVQGWAATRYVWTNSPAPGGGYTFWTNAARTIQDAVDVSVAGDRIVVTNGVYSTGGRIADDATTNRVAIDVAVTVVSVNGPTVTVIRGQGPIGPGAIRCAYVGAGAVLGGFTLTNGYTRSGFGNEMSGGGAWCDSGGVLSNCVMTGNFAAEHGAGARGGSLYGCTLIGNGAAGQGGGVYLSTLYNCNLVSNSVDDSGGGAGYSTLYNCTLTGNSADGYGGGAYVSSLSNCVVSSNTAVLYGGGVYDAALYGCSLRGNSAADSGGGAYGSAPGNCTLSNSVLMGNAATNEGGGAYGVTLHGCVLTGNTAANAGGGASQSTLYNCTLSGNAATNDGGGAFWCTAYNCVLWYNTASDGTNWAGGGLYFSCTTPLPGGEGNIAGDPEFVNRAGGDYRLAGNSPCVDTGTNQGWMAGTLDLGGTQRVVNGIVDMGAYEAIPIHYVWTNGNHVWPYARWQDAATNIQAAVDAAVRGDTVVVTNGVYDKGGRAVYGNMTNRVAVDKPVTVRSVNGPAMTIITGQGPLGNGAVRCVYLGTNALLEGFTLTNGFTRSAGDVGRERNGGGVWCDSASVVSNCVITGNSAATNGGGAYQGTLYNSVLYGNSANNHGGGAYSGTLYNCTLVGNTAVRQGGGTYTSTLSNCILYYNAAPTATNWGNSTLSYSCTMPLPAGVGNTTNAPMFVNTNVANYRLLTGSPCINKGTNLTWMAAARDLDGRPRIVGGRVDMGAYEGTNGTTASGISWGWLLDHNLATDGSADTADPDADEMDNGEEYAADTDPNSAASLLVITNIQRVAQGIRVDWLGGVAVTQYLERAESAMATGIQWRAVVTNVPQTPVATNFVDVSAPVSNAFYRIKTVR